MYRARLPLLIGLVAALLITAPAFAEQPTALKGRFQIPFRSELKGQHPRLLFSGEQMRRWWAEPKDPQQFIWDAGKGYFDSCRGSAPAGEPWNEGDGWQRIGWWRGTTTVMVYAKTGDKRYARAAIDLMMAMSRSEHWEVGGEQDYGMGTGNIMATVALIYDITYDLLTEDQRQLVRRRLWLAADRFYHYGFNDLKRNPDRAVRYWQNDPQNNHRWHRLCGYLLGLLAIHGEQPGTEGYLDHAIKEAKFILKWLPTDGSCHESVGYQAFGTQFLTPAIVALDNCTGSEYLTTHRAFREFPHFRTHMVTPDRKHVWSFGDGGESPFYFSHYNFRLAAAWRDTYMQAAHTANFKAAPGSYAYHGFSLIYHDPTLAQGDLADYPTHRYFPDMEIATFRQSWSDPNALAVFFKCSPYGGHLLNEYRDSFRPPHYVNVAHDHPDANSFLLAWKGELFLQDFGTKDRRTAEHNTIIPNGEEQAGAGDGWTQPIENMGRRARIDQYFGAPGYGMVRGQAGGFYDSLNRYARTFLYVDDAYVLIADDIAARGPATEIQWYFNSTGEFTGEADRWRIHKGDATIAVHVVAGDWAGAKVIPNGRGRALTVLSKPVKRPRLLTLVAPQSQQPATVEFSRYTVTGVMARLRRGDRTDLVTIGPKTAAGAEVPIQTDAEAAVVTLEGDRPVKLMVIGGRFLRMGDRQIRFSRPANALLDVGTGAMRLSVPLGSRSVTIKVTVSDLPLRSVNGVAMTGSDGSVSITMPTWQQRQDAEDGFDDLPSRRAKR